MPRHSSLRAWLGIAALGAALGTGAPAQVQAQVQAQAQAQAQDLPDAAGQGSTPPRPRIGLALGGGGAKGAAHVGVLEVLEELRVPVDCVTGTSMGALVGATFAAGVRPAEIKERVVEIDWAATVGSAGLRERTPINRKLQGETYSNSLEFGLRNGGLSAPGGFLKTQDIEELLRSLVAGARYIQDFDELPIPFRAVATDMLAGEMVVLGEGDLSVAMRASMAVPGAFSPVVQGDRILSDGGMMRNLPVDIARELCADVVIAVNLASPPPTPAELQSALGLASRSLDVMIDANTKAQLLTLTDRDVAITVPMGTIGSASFDRVPDAIPLGRAAALAQQAALARYALPPAEYAAWRADLDRDYAKPFRIAAVEVKGLDRVNPEYVKSQVKAAPGALVTARSLEADTTRIYSLGDFERVEYQLTGDPELPTLELTAVEKSWGPDFLRFDLGLAASGGGELYFGLRGDHRRTWLNRRGGTWRNALQIGDLSLAETALYQPLDVRQRFFVEPMARVERTREDIYLDGDREADYRFVQYFGQLDLGVNFSSRAQLRAGIRRGVAEAQVETGGPALPEQDSIAVTEALVTALYDTRDRPAAATRGTLFRLDLGTAGSGIGGKYRYDFVDAMLLKTVSFRGDVIYVGAGAGGELDGELSPFRQYRLGGLRSFPGLERHQLRGNSYWAATAFYNWKLTDIQPLFGQALYANVRFSAGRMGERIDGIREGAIYGASASLFGSTPLGPVSLTLGGTDNGFFELQFGFGMPISEGNLFDLLN